MAAINLAQLTFRETGDGWVTAFDPFNIERWTWVVGLEGLYEVSSRGRARSVSRIVLDSSGKWQTKPSVMLSLVPDRRGQGYLLFNTPNTHRHCAYVHRAVAEAFLPPPPSPAHNEVDHIDGDARNNDARNLEWVTRAEQMERAKARGVFSYRTNPNRANSHKGKKLTPQLVADIQSDMLGGMLSKDICDKYGICHMHAQKIKQGRSHHNLSLTYPLGPTEVLSGRALSERMGNRGVTGVRGVSMDHGRYRARIMVNGKSVAVGHYKTLAEAIAAREAAEKKHWG